MSTAWKSLEKTTAKILKGRRIIRMSYSEISPDVKLKDFPSFKIDTKRYKRFRVFLLFMKQLRGNIVENMVTIQY